VPNTDYSVLAINDLGMHCGDYDTRVAGILPPFQVLFAQVSQKSADPTGLDKLILGGNFYEPADTQPLVPWANEPGCGSYHTGDANSNAITSGQVDVSPGGDAIANIKDTYGNTDGTRLRQAFRTGDNRTTPIVPVNTRFAENPILALFNGFANPGAGEPKLYRLSPGYGGVFCEGCHGATHAEWPNANPKVNDNVTANQLQGHTGTIVECSTCHRENAFSVEDFKGSFGA
jgi:hypothetical protein